MAVQWHGSIVLIDKHAESLQYLIMVSKKEFLDNQHNCDGLPWAG